MGPIYLKYNIKGKYDHKSYALLNFNMKLKNSIDVCSFMEVHSYKM